MVGIEMHLETFFFFLSTPEAGVMTYGFVTGRPCNDRYYCNIFQNFPENILNGAI